MKLSIIVPIYNAEKYLKNCIESLLNQNYDDYEILLINDGSKDSSGLICDDYAKKYKNIHVIHKENGGLSSVRNNGIHASNGEYIFFVDADDWIEPNCIPTLLNMIQTNNLDVLRFNYIREFNDKSIPKINTILEERLYEGEEDINLVLNKLIGISGKDLRHPENFNFLASSCFNIYRKSIIIENNLQFHDTREYGAFEDGIFNIEFFMHVHRFEYTNKICYHYTKTNGNSLTSNYRKNYLLRQIKLFSDIKTILISHNKYNDVSFSNRISLSTIELCLNAIRNKEEKPKQRYLEIKSILSNETLHNSLKKIKTKEMPYKWKVFFFCAKHKLTLCVYLLTLIMQKLKGRK